MLAKDPKSRPSLAQVCALIDRVRNRPATPLPLLVTPTPMPIARPSPAPVVTHPISGGAAPRAIVAASATPLPHQAEEDTATNKPTTMLASVRGPRWGRIMLSLVGLFVVTVGTYILVAGQLGRDKLAGADRAANPPPEPAVEQTVKPDPSETKPSETNP